MDRFVRKIKFLTVAVCMLGAVSCQNYLDLTDPESLSEGNFPTSIEHIDLIVNSVYGAQHHWYFLGNYWAGYVMYCLDHTIDLQYHADQGWVDILAGDVKADNAKVTDPWTGLSLGVYYANSALEKIAQYRQLRLLKRLHLTTMKENACFSGHITGGTCFHCMGSPIWTKTADPEDHLANDPLLYERWAEMFGEMRWWEDVRRLRIGKQEAEYYKTVSGPGAAKTNLVWNDKTYAMPIPAREFESNPSPGMVQTPGYN